MVRLIHFRELNAQISLSVSAARESRVPARDSPESQRCSNIR